MTFEGFVQPSRFLAVFLSVLAALGLSCLALVLYLLYPSSQGLFFILVLLAPYAGFFYWQRAGRSEKVILKVENNSEQSLIHIIGHRDELIELQKYLESITKKS